MHNQSDIIKIISQFHKRYRVGKILMPVSLLESCYLIHAIVTQKNYDIGICISPEALRYGALFDLFGLRTLAVYMDDSDPTRNYRELDDLKSIKGKNIIVIEDDVVTGKTLEIFFEKIKQYSPASISLFLGNPKRFQKGLQNIPNCFQSVYVVPDAISDVERKQIIAILQLNISKFLNKDWHRMKILFTVDLHGDKRKYEYLLQSARLHKPDVILNGGDLLPKTDGNAIFELQSEFFEYLERHFSVFEKKKIYYLCFFGNDDLKIYDERLDRLCQHYEYIKNIGQRKIEIKGYEFIGMNWVVDYPFRIKDRCRKDTKEYQIGIQYGTALLSTKDGFKEIIDWESYINRLPTMQDELNKLPLARNMKNTVYVIHMPPAGLGLDVCSDGRKVGSRAVYDFLLQKQPRMSLHGHIHESPDISDIWKANIGRTICIQPGQSGKLTYVLIDLSTNAINLFQQ